MSGPASDLAWLVLAVVAAGLLLGGCGVEPRVGSPHWNRDACEHCRMALSTPRYAAQLVGPGARVSFFDDLGCAVAAQAQRGDLAEAEPYVLRPGSREDWVRARELRYSDGHRTPMDYGIAASPEGTLSFAEAEALLLERTRSGRRAR